MTGELQLLDTVERIEKAYTVARNESGQRFIFCHTCRKRSYNDMDISQKYCAFCKRWHES
jgi:hypothetical protein